MQEKMKPQDPQNLFHVKFLFTEQKSYKKYASQINIQFNCILVSFL